MEFVNVDKKIIKSNVSDGTKTLYSLLCSYCYGDKDTCFPSQTTLANDLGVTVRTIQRRLKELVQAGFIEVKRRGLTLTNIYRIINKVKTKAVAKARATVEKVRSSYKNKFSTFNNCSQREYTKEDLNDLERKLLGWD